MRKFEAIYQLKPKSKTLKATTNKMNFILDLNNEQAIYEHILNFLKQREGYYFLKINTIKEIK